MFDKKRDMCVKWCVRCLVLAIVGVGVRCAFPSYTRSQELKRRVADLEQRLDCKRQEIADLNEKQRRFQSDRDFIESIAHQNRKLYTDEVVFIFEDE